MILNIIIGIVVVIILSGIMFFLHWAIVKEVTSDMTEKEKEEYFNSLNKIYYDNK